MTKGKRSRPVLARVTPDSREAVKDSVLSARVPPVLMDVLSLYAKKEGKNLTHLVQSILTEEAIQRAKEEGLVYVKWFFNTDQIKGEVLCPYLSLAGKIDDKPLYPRSDFESLVKQVSELIPDKRLRVPVDLYLALKQHGYENPYTFEPGLYQLETRILPTSDEVPAEYLLDLTGPGVMEKKAMAYLWQGLSKEEIQYVLERRLRAGEITERKYRVLKEILDLYPDITKKYSGR